MKINQLWTKLFRRNDEADEIALHIAGATVRHRNPFEHLEVPRNEEELSQKFVDQWVVPFYFFDTRTEESVLRFAQAAREINIDIVKKLLGDFDWRPRITGAYFAAINQYQELEDIIGRHLLKSEVCYAGQGYCLALAAFGTHTSQKYLTDYLKHYLEQKDLWFDQASALAALYHLSPEEADKLTGQWNTFIADKENWNLERSRAGFNESMTKIEQIKKVKVNQ
ncbi:hypothetical protein HF329_26205 [Chitinophaga oryzae]|uniref:Uncharacterized protein n=1 Tax=Chitinophaga oryzae TaxID=2725414 RepID=A0AAE6ZMD9_9BACT|nr:DUF6000 family protein [Chitinophaga oryzae]QJB34603.1 hypothetical protein HF329_26205 [Chitinophaga oryzae]